MYTASGSKLKSTHLERSAYLYIRQSTLRQVYENTESTKRQYGLKKKAAALGWPEDSIIVIDSDLGVSGASSGSREGFKKLVAEVGMGHAGIVVSIEVSRLSRNSSDWLRLLEICAITDTLIMDEDGIYDVNDFNDRLLLGLKGTMSEAEIHFLQARMRGGTISKAKRGELKRTLPAGYVYNSFDKIVMDPDASVQNAINLFFNTFKRTGSACATVREFNRSDLKIPKRLLCGPRKGELVWNPLEHSRTLRILQNPIYAGIYYYGRSQIKNTINGKRPLSMPVDDWHVYMPDAHPGYITVEQFEENLKKLKDNCCAYGQDRRKSPPREGPALLQGIVLCGKCGRRMSVRYQKNCSKLVPIYMCIKDYIKSGAKVCQTVNGEKVDEEIGKLILEMLNPLAIGAAIKVEEELKSRAIETDSFHRQQIERAGYEAEIARKRYMLVDPANRLVATELESEWNSEIRELERLKEEYENKKKDALRQMTKTTTSDITSVSQKLNDKYTIGPWKLYDLSFRGEKDKKSINKSSNVIKTAIYKLNDVELVLIEPESNDNILFKDLMKRGSGPYFITFQVNDYEKTLNIFMKKEGEIVLSGNWYGRRFSFLDTRKDLKFITCIIQDTSEFGKPDPYPQR